MSYSRSVIKNDAGEPIGIDHHYPESEMDRDFEDYEYDAQFDEEEDSDYIRCENKKNGMDCFEQNYNNWTESGVHSFQFYCYKNPFVNFGCESCITTAEIEGWFEF